MDMDKYFYSIEMDENGEKYIHLSGNIYFNDVDESETNYRCAEWTFMMLSITEAQNMLKDNNDKFFDYINERVAYLEDITKEEAEEYCKNYFNGTSGIKLDIRDITPDTECGNYWFGFGD